MAVVALLVASPAWAASDMERQKAAEEIALAKEAAGRQQFRVAFDHALGAWQLDAENAGYLLDAAAYAVAAGMDDRGHDLAKEWLSLAHRDRGHDGRARQLLATVGRRKAAVLAKEAAEASKAGDHAGARQKFLAAAKLDPGEAEYLFGAGVEAVAVGDQVAGRRLLTEYLAVSPASAGNRAEAERLLGQQQPSGPKSSPAVVRQPEPDTDVTYSRPGIGLTIGGGAIALTGIGFLVAWRVAESDFAAATRANAPGAVSDPLRATAGSRLATGAVLSGVGAAAAGLGGWLLWKSAPTSQVVAVFPSSQGVMVAGQF